MIIPAEHMSYVYVTLMQYEKNSRTEKGGGRKQECMHRNSKKQNTKGKGTYERISHT